MLYYEWKKIWVRTGCKITMLVLAVTLAVVSFLAIHDVYYIDENGEHVYGVAAVRTLKEMKKEWAGVLTEEVIAKVIEENNRINSTPYGQSEDIRESNIAYGWKLGFHDIRYLIMRSYCKFREGDYYKPDRLVPEDASRFYENRLASLQEWLAEDEEAQWRLSKKEREFLIERYEAWETPLTYDYAEGWKQLKKYSVTIIMLMVLILGFAAAGIFSGEFSYKADAVFYASCHGRGRAVAAKLGAGILFVTSVYAATIAVYTTVILGLLGTDGAGLAIQTNMDEWKSYYYITNCQEYMLIVAGGYIGTMFILLLTMLVSAWTKSTALSASVPFMLIFLPNFFAGSSHALISKIVSISPDRLLDIAQGISTFALYSLGGKIVDSLTIIFPLYSILSFAACPLIYRIFCRKEAG